MTEFDSLRIIEAAYCTGMSDPIHSYAGGGIPTEVSRKRGVKGFMWISPSGEFRIVDRWTKHPTSKGVAGTTNLWRNRVLELSITTAGWYDTEAIPFLKTTLLEAYQKKIFHLGRGPEYTSTTDGLHYRMTHIDDPNMPEYAMRGYERIENNEGRLCGEHYVFVVFPGMVRKF